MGRIVLGAVALLCIGWSLAILGSALGSPLREMALGILAGGVALLFYAQRPRE